MEKKFGNYYICNYCGTIRSELSDECPNQPTCKALEKKYNERIVKNIKKYNEKREVKEMHRFLLFGFDNYYPSGGIDDLITSFNENEIENVFDILSKHTSYDSYQVYDSLNKKAHDFDSSNVDYEFTSTRIFDKQYAKEEEDFQALKLKTLKKWIKRR